MPQHIQKQTVQYINETDYEYMKNLKLTAHLQRFICNLYLIKKSFLKLHDSPKLYIVLDKNFDISDF